ncbi:MAG TPA: threonine--tRNA ligase [Sulfurovum sp.]|nr:MAG: threonine--tRNA ligase [Sulfurovum sp. 35-42-20]OYY55623.1 MAG: threonine--tRNA ligase [Sulfurovum sp. 28-43-6]OYZ23749.1 MAG: threonine--tRNA ligase [Sulfurovum sp. 16-42-52]OYZ48157.1 MAG: threonine--tRNA ligase [Sulfurovum sp. 24-42-9]OZA43612.1 MAG: threonine--tRNA ligase [Sulfurovum sp. 17-42-90]OZA60644.1 MAG: threonine--tRNA ligase [Sulfurovum sp. 39-42-12]HQR74643.1 threonine--tRNA ligase [Sulfurovum sp.]
MSENLIGYIDNQGNIIDTQSAGENCSATPIEYDNSDVALEIIRHSTAHLMAQAITELYPNSQFFVGPVVDEGFYYDFRVDQKIGEEDLKTIEKKMKDLIKQKFTIEKYEMSKAEALEKFAHDDLKQKVMSRITDEVLSVYKQGNFEDLCRGPHVPALRFLHNFKLTRVAGAYLGGDEKAEMLTRIYGIAFADKETLQAHLTMLEEAKKRDHRKIGQEMELFMFNDAAGPGLPFWMPKGAKLRYKLESILHKAHLSRGYEPVRGPEILKADMWRTSGHYACYGENMYLTTIDEQEYGIKPMNCLGHIQVFKQTPKSYRDLPLRYYEYGLVHRHEKSGVLHGLLRVREFTQDDAHIFCETTQIAAEVLEVVGFVDAVMKLFGFEYTMEVATKPDKAIGDDAVWELATQGLKDALNGNNLPFSIDEGGGAFYGPKIDIKITDAIGRKWQCGTIQVDFNLPERFEVEYVGADNERKRPVMIHRAILGSFERFIGILTEHYAGEFPFFLAPVQVIVVPIAESHVEYAYALKKRLLQEGMDAEVYDKNDSLNKRVRNAEKQRVPYVVIVGDEEAANQTVAIRDRRAKEQYNLTQDEFMVKLTQQLQEGKI